MIWVDCIHFYTTLCVVIVMYYVHDVWLVYPVRFYTVKFAIKWNDGLFYIILTESSRGGVAQWVARLTVVWRS